MGTIMHGDHVSIDHDGETPLWRQLADLIRGQIESGKLPRGRRVPSENTLAQEYGVAMALHLARVRSITCSMTRLRLTDTFARCGSWWL